MQKSDRQLSAYYAARAGEYERVYDKPERQADLARLRDLIPGYFVDRRVLEIACGTGYWTQFIAPVARKITAIDINPETLAIARSKQLPENRVSFDVGDVQCLSPRYEAFTGAFAGFWWSHLRRGSRGAFLESLHRALSPGAIVVALDNLYVEGSSTPVSHTDADGNSYQCRELADGTKHTVLKNFPAEAELVADIETYATAVKYTALEYYWVLKYELTA
ncbi:MAG: putative methyltransferase [Betaproteobacteria bacterium]|jgi:ubiquinone/menaquinone biosynthesis C-methylase UbiE|nr:putative methyltransferase [Betaproteobacteria bacterium]